MNFLAICQIAAGMAGWSGPTTVVAQTGDNARMVNWVREAWKDIQDRNSQWKWMRKQSYLTTSADKGTYTPTEIGISSTFDHFYMDRLTFYRLTDGQITEKPLNSLSYENWFSRWGYGTFESNTPADVTVSQPGSVLILSPTPDDEYRVRFDYQSLATDLVADTDIPDMPEKHHYLLVYEALKLYALWDNAPEKLFLANEQIEKYWYALVGDQAPSISLVSQPITRT